MRFASIGGSNAGNYAQAGKAVADTAAEVFDVQRKTGPRYDELSEVAMKTQSAEKIAAMETAAQVTEEGINQLKNKTLMKHAIGVYNHGKDLQKKQRKAGAIAGLGKIGAAAFLATRKDDREYPTNSKAKNDVLQESLKQQREILDRMAENDKAGLDAGDALINSNSNSTSSTSTGDDSGKAVVGGSNTSQTVGSGNTGVGANFDMTKLTKKDYDDLAYAISSEAQLGTDDEFGVAANILTRLKSGKYGKSVHEIIHAPGQYEGVYKGLSRSSPQISARLQTPEGQAKILEFMTTLNGRTEFKGQSMLRNRVPSEDPMFSPGGNFYHYAGQ